MSGRTFCFTRVAGVLASTVAIAFVGAALAAPAQGAPKRAAPAGGATRNAAPGSPTAPASTTTTPAVAGRTSMASPGYWVASAAGEVGSYGGVPYRSSLLSTHTNAPTVALVPTYDGAGYWLAGSDGGVFAFGDAGYYGSLSGRTLNARVVALASTASDQGYWLAAADGGVFAFGNANYYGSPSGSHLAASVVAMLPTPDSRGYWLVSADGGVFAYGDARYLGSLVGTSLNKPIIAAAATADGAGYWLVSADGGVFAFGDANYYGAASTTSLDKAVTAIAATPDDKGYWLAAADGGVFAFGDATFRGSAYGNVGPFDRVVSIATGPGTSDAGGVAGNFVPAPPTSSSAPAPRAAAAPVSQGVGTKAPGAIGYDISWPQCRTGFPAPSTLAIVGINDGTAFTTNPCFRREAAWAGLNLSVYVNLNAPDPHFPDQFANGPAGPCPPGASACDSYNYGYNAATNAVEQVRAAGYSPRDVWLDVETANIWSPDTSLNDQVISGAISALQHAGANPGLYSTGRQYGEIAGSFRASVPEWLATGVGLSASPGCASSSFTGGRVTLVQGGLGPFDGDVAC